MRVRFMAFRQAQDLPGGSMKMNAAAWSGNASELGYLMVLDWARRCIRLEVPPEYMASHDRVGAWRRPDGKEIYGLGAVRYIPFEAISYFELVDDAVPEPQEKPKPQPQQKPAAQAEAAKRS